MDGVNVDSGTKDKPIVLINEEGAFFWYARNWYQHPEDLYDLFLRDIKWEQLSGEYYDIPRLTYHMGNERISNYTKYSGKVAKYRPWNPVVKKKKDIMWKVINCN